MSWLADWLRDPSVKNIDVDGGDRLLVHGRMLAQKTMMNGAHQALSYIVVERDRAEFEQRFPQLNIVHQEVCDNYLAYCLSSGLNFRQLWPNWARPLLSLIQRLLKPLSRWLGLHHVVVIRGAG